MSRPVSLADVLGEIEAIARTARNSRDPGLEDVSRRAEALLLRLREEFIQDLLADNLGLATRTAA